MDPIEDLKSILSMELLSAEYDGTSSSTEIDLIKSLVWQVKLWEHGSMSTEDLERSCSRHDLGNFDLLFWIQSNVDAGEYMWPDNDDPSEEGRESDLEATQENQMKVLGGQRRPLLHLEEATWLSKLLRLFRPSGD